MTRSKRSRNTRQNNTIARATATAAAIPNCKEQLVSDPIGKYFMLFSSRVMPSGWIY